MIKRRQFLCNGLAAGLAAGFAQVLPVGPAGAAPRVRTRARLRFGVAYPIAPSGPADDAYRLARSVERAFPDCAIDLVYEPGDAVSVLGQGKADAYFGPLSAARRSEPTLALLNGTPEPFAVVGESHRQPQAQVRTILEDCLAPLSIRCIAMSDAGRGGGTWSRHRIDAFSNVTIASTGLAAEIWAALGAHPIEIEPHLLASALNDGLVDAVDCPSIETAAALGILGTASHCLTGGPTRRSDILAFSVKREIWDGFAPADQTRLATLTEISLAQRDARITGEAEALRRCSAAAFGISFASMTSTNEAAAHRVASAIVAEIATRMPLRHRLVAQA